MTWSGLVFPWSYLSPATIEWLGLANGRPLLLLRTCGSAGLIKACPPSTHIITLVVCFGNGVVDFTIIVVGAPLPITLWARAPPTLKFMAQEYAHMHTSPCC